MSQYVAVWSTDLSDRLHMFCMRTLRFAVLVTSYTRGMCAVCERLTPVNGRPLPPFLDMFVCIFAGTVHHASLSPRQQVTGTHVPLLFSTLSLDAIGGQSLPCSTYYHCILHQMACQHHLTVSCSTLHRTCLLTHATWPRARVVVLIAPPSPQCHKQSS